jgi:dTDP-4-amino-4,6-dideoxygalactose transaminase
MKPIPFNRPHLDGKELEYIAQAVASGKISGDGMFSARCHRFFEERFGFPKALLTTSCTDALEMSAILLDIRPGDEVIVPSFTFVSTANAFALRGAKLRFVDSLEDNPNLDHERLAELVTPRTRAVVVMHYAGVACDMDPILDLVGRHGIAVVEDAAQAVDSTYKGRYLGGIGEMGAFSFHETKNVISGEGGLLTLRDPTLSARAEIIREKGTNRSAFFRGEVDKYGWVDIGSSFLPSDLIAAYLYAQLESLDAIQARRKALWSHYHERLSAPLAARGIGLPHIPDFATNNAHMFYLVCHNLDQRTKLIAALKSHGISAVFHYQSLHKSQYFQAQHDGRELPQADRYTDCLVRLPLFHSLQHEEVDYVCDRILEVLAPT